MTIEFGQSDPRQNVCYFCVNKQKIDIDCTAGSSDANIKGKLSNSICEASN